MRKFVRRTNYAMGLARLEPQAGNGSHRGSADRDVYLEQKRIYRNKIFAAVIPVVEIAERIRIQF